MNNANKKKKEQLGMPYGTACGRLRKLLMFQMAQHLEMDICYRCGNKIETARDLSVEHKIAWLDSDDPVGLFFNMDNIAFSHLSCNASTGRRYRSPHGTPQPNNKHGCRCPECVVAKAKERQFYKERNIKKADKILGQQYFSL